MKAEYKVLETSAPTASLEQLNALGADGWELVSIIPWSGKWFYYFKRMLAN